MTTLPDAYRQNAIGTLTLKPIPLGQPLNSNLRYSCQQR